MKTGPCLPRRSGCGSNSHPRPRPAPPRGPAGPIGRVAVDTGVTVLTYTARGSGGSGSPAHGPCSAVRSLIGDGDCFHFDHEIRMCQAPHLHGGTGGQRPEIFHPDVHMLEELVDVCHISGGLHQVLQRRPGGCEGRLEVLTHLANLCTHVTFANNIAMTV